MHFQTEAVANYQPETPGPLHIHLAPQIHSLKGVLEMDIWPHTSGETGTSPVVNSAKQGSAIQQVTGGTIILGSLGTGLS